jgi:hypothetical protein
MNILMLVSVEPCRDPIMGHNEETKREVEKGGGKAVGNQDVVKWGRVQNVTSMNERKVT